MRNVGIYIDADSIPETGGGHTYTSSIVQFFTEQNKRINNKYKIFFIYDSVNKKIKNKENNLNIKDYHQYKTAVFLFKKAVNKVYRTIFKKNLYYIYFNSLNILIKKYQIAFILFTTPVYYKDINCPYIYTVWDLGHRNITVFPEVSRDEFCFDSREEMYSYMIPRASFIITGNSVGADEIKRYYNYDQDRIFQIEFFTPAFVSENKKALDKNLVLQKLNINKKYIFYPAQFWPHKNHIVILEAVKLLKEKYKIDLQVIFSGSDKGNMPYIKRKTREYGLEENIVFAGFVSEDQLIILYQNTEMMVFASLLGPNNLPPFEAMALGCPVLLSDIPGHKEQCGEMAIYFNPLSAADLSEKIVELLNNKKNNKQRIVNAEKFSLDNSIDKYMTKIEAVFDKLSYLISRWS